MPNMKKAEPRLSDVFAMANTDLQCFMDKNNNTQKPVLVWDVGLGWYLG